MKRRKKHEVFARLDLSRVEVGNRDVVFDVKKRGSKFGELRISRGAIVWRGRMDVLGRKLSWKRFDDLMESVAPRHERRPPRR
jgi:hypothetical protein